MTDIQQQIVLLTEELLLSITSRDFVTYSQLVDPNVTSFEEETLGNLDTGIGFHKFYFDNNVGKDLLAIRTTVINPKVHVMGKDAACIAYVRLTQYIDKSGVARSKQTEETRVWHYRDGKWQNVHFHRSNIKDQLINKS